jgi:MraZ protein
MLINSYEHTVDAKGRIFIPAKWRDDLGDTVIVTRGLAGKGDHRCLFGMSLATWQAFLDKFKGVAMADIVTQNALRKTFAMACECELDKQGRILITNSLREQAGIEKDVTLIGMGNRIELWDTGRWQAVLNSEEEMDDEVLAHLAGLGI